MEFMVLLLALLGDVVVASFNELPVHPGVGGLYKGPNSETIIKGPDGSVITAEAEGGSVLAQPDTQPIVAAALAEPIIPIATASIPSPAADVIVPAVATVTALPQVHKVEIIQQDPHIIETELVDAPVIPVEQSSNLVGPSGSISTRGSSSIVSGPASTTISEPAKVLVAPAVVAALPVVASVAAPVAQPIQSISIATASIPLQPNLSTVTVGPPISAGRLSPSASSLSVSTIAPRVDLGNIGLGVYPASTVAPPTSWKVEEVVSSTITPPASWNLLQNSQLSTPLPPTTLSEQTGIVGQSVASVEPASSYGVINNVVNGPQISTTVRPIPSTLGPQYISTERFLPPQLSQTKLGIAISNDQIAAAKFRASLEQALINNKQLNINPLLISSANIIPPEIGRLSPGAIDLGTTVTVTPVAGGQNIQGIVDNTVKTDGRVIEVQEPEVQGDGRLGKLDGNQQISIQNQILVSNSGGNVDGKLLLSQTASPATILPFPNGITQGGLVHSGLAKYGLDSSQINLANVPLPSVAPLANSGAPLSSGQLQDHSSVYWGRYNRDVSDVKKKSN